MTKRASTIFGGEGGIRLAPDLTFPSTLTAAGIVTVVGVNTTAALTEMLGLSGPHAIELIDLTSLTAESAQIKLTIGGEIIWNDTFVLPGTSLRLVGNDGGIISSAIISRGEFSLEVQMSADTSIGIDSIARPIK